MLRNIPKIIPPELLKILSEMGHGDTVILADANYPAATGAQRLVRTDGSEVTELLDAILPFFPLDVYVTSPVALMAPVQGDSTPEIWAQYREIIKKHDTDKAFNDFELVERMQFYEDAKNAFAIVQTGTTAKYANISLKKGVI
ncbi:MAG: fucose operon FucU protein [Oscillospiraceae bacterium]|nr:fucose operon FucU protein [Oscillospiraceae bacterium]